MESEALAKPADFLAATVSPDRVRCVDHWNALLARIGEHDAEAERAGTKVLGVPSFPVWGFELDPWNHYPIDVNPGGLIGQPAALRAHRRALLDGLRLEQWARATSRPGDDRAFLLEPEPSEAQLSAWTASWPKYASSRGEWPRWKQRFIELSRAWGFELWRHLDGAWLRGWLDELLEMVPSHQKLEWNCLDGDRDLWKHILQFRPSGLRVKRCLHVPALVAMTATQVPVMPCHRVDGAARGRHLLPEEGLLLQGFPRTWSLPAMRGDAFAALGNAVHAELVSEIVLSWLFEKDGPHDRLGNLIGADATPTTSVRERVSAGPLFEWFPEVPAQGVASTARRAPRASSAGAISAK